MDLTAVFSTFCVRRFIDDFYLRLPLALSGSAADLVSLGTPEALGNVVLARDVDLMIVRQGQRCAAPTPQTATEIRRILSQRSSILVRHAERHHPAIADVAALFERTFEGSVNVHMWATPRQSFGFSWHYDAEEVFIVQTTGEKDYDLRKNTVNPWPLEETLPRDMHYEREIMPLMRTRLRAGDLLYIPSGYWHKASTSGECELAISLAIGVMPRTALGIFDQLRRELLEDLLWRQRLPVTHHLPREESASAYQQLLTSLAADLGRRLTRPAMIDKLAGCFAPDSGS